VANKPKKQQTTKAAASDETVVRIKAGGAPSKKTAKAEPATVKEKAVKVKKPRTGTGIRGLGFLRLVGAYFKGAWVELRQVRWPNRGATWSLTGAVLAYSAFFVVFVLLLDAGFKYLFELLLKK
jgi:preprotein translocase SecE subunit